MNVITSSLSYILSYHYLTSSLSYHPHTTALSNRIDFITKYVPPFALVTRMQISEMRKGNRFF